MAQRVTWQEAVAAIRNARAHAGADWPSTVTNARARWPMTEEAWEGRARMAVARRDSGLPLDDCDREALKRYPSPRSAWQTADDLA